ncbi:AlpA family phage regulatory protein [Pseudoalteromonas sp. CO348]|uniref:helix-turn-helix transcriptional regulator n=1 Tax=Pseudoalteromonas sp. CO348 TaxID=1777271 RepID=UPI001022A8FB|nr:AlpA family phage regulatory protein [Pseudoalteromonas sp. CO348]RZG05530.1 AlpA family phage regulatory protein [Pseudoalteromonas sp. CO348]
MDKQKFRKNLLGEVVGPNEGFLRLERVMEMCGMSQSHIYKLMSEGKFPRSQKLTHRCSVWLETDINLWRSMTTESFYSQYGEQLLQAKELAA